jgi:hypothetical protein
MGAGRDNSRRWRQLSYWANIVCVRVTPRTTHSWWWRWTSVAS